MTQLPGLAAIALAGTLVAACGSPTSMSAASNSSTSSTSSSSSSSSTSEPADTGTDVSSPSTTQDSSAYNDMPIGQRVDVSGTTLDNKGNEVPYAVSVTVQSIKTSRSAISEFGDKPKHKYVGLLALYQCTKGTCSYNPFDFKVRSDGGDEYDASFDSFDPQLQSGDLRAGRKARGYVTYDLPRGKYVIEYQASAVDQTSASWRFAVS